MKKANPKKQTKGKAPPEIKAVIWDNAGVLGQAKCGSFAKLWIERLGAPVEDVIRVLTGPEHALSDKGEMDKDDFFDYVIREIGLPSEKKEALDSISWDDVDADMELFDYIWELHKKYKTAILSNFPQYLLDKQRAAMPWMGEIFDQQIFSSEVHLLKPEPEIYRLALDRLGVEANEAVFIDDRQENVDGALAVGMHAILYKSRAQVIKELDGILPAKDVRCL